MNPRFEAIAAIGNRHQRFMGKADRPASTYFGEHVFNRRVMKKRLPSKVYKNVCEALDGREKINPEFADVIAEEMKKWALSLGATHFTHWFQPMTGAAAEKHDAFLDFTDEGQIIEKFSGRQLFQGEPDASSFPSGGLRSTFEARGYTGWDPTSPAFIWKAGDGITLCIPSVFFSWTGDVLDQKIPLLRSQEKLNRAVLRMLKFTGIEANAVFSTIGLEQEYFVVDRSLRDLRPDLVLAGRTVFGALPSKGQELQDHYLGSVKDRILNFLREFEVEAIKLGIPVKTRHNEVAPAQHEIAPLFEKASLAIDHNILTMELMRQVATRHHLSCLLHEKPFGELNGSGKHCNWSLVTDTGMNLLNPTENNLHFLLLLTAILQGVHKHAKLLRASIGSAGNDHRLGGHEAPPAIMSIYLGAAMEEFLQDIEEKGAHVTPKAALPFDLGYLSLPQISRDNTDRNRTSPIAFTGNKFEIRALGSSANPSFLVAVFNLIVAESLNEIMDEIEIKGVLPTVQERLKTTKEVRFSGDNYSKDWIALAKRRNLPNITKSIDAFEALKMQETIKVFDGVLTKEELACRYDIESEIYKKVIKIEAKLMLELFHSQILPAALQQQKEMAKSIAFCTDVLKGDLSEQKKDLKILSETIDLALQIASELKKGEDVIPLMERLRVEVDKLEGKIDDSKWQLPKYRELLFLY